jgi:rubredoxin
MGEAKRKAFKYLPNSPDDASFVMEIIKIPRSELISMFNLNKAEFLARRATDNRFMEIPQNCIQYFKQMQDLSIPTKLCLLCDYEYDQKTPPEMTVILRPHTKAAHTNMFQVLCPRCAKQDYDVIDTKVLETHKKEFPGLSTTSWTPQCDL